MSIASEITRLQGVKSDILQAITDNGVTVPAGSALDDCPGLISSISGGGGPYPKLYYRMSEANGGMGWTFGSNVCKTGNAGEFGINTGLATYSLCPYINNAKKIYVKYKLNFTTTFSACRILDTDFDSGFRLFTNYIYGDGSLDFYLQNGGTNAYTFSTYTILSLNRDYKFEHLLDVENGIFTTKINDAEYIRSNVDVTLLNLQRYIPALGMRPNYATSYLPYDLKFYRDEFSYKIDDVEQIPQETLD